MSRKMQSALCIARFCGAVAALTALYGLFVSHTLAGPPIALIGGGAQSARPAQLRAAVAPSPLPDRSMRLADLRP